ncbi:MAG TPA: MarR family winged helix-turn-helix transcriptional regulator [Ktedonobacteraceae bacterium]|nr:MarR family winged helix-turn-helix transcriptional regulator [Ktedonobacteraceae bacterium]
MEGHSDNPTAQKLMRAFMQFHRLQAHQRNVAGCTPGEIRMLFFLRHAAGEGNPEMKVSEISKRLNVTSPSVTQLLKGLEANGLVERHIDPADRRAVGITLTKRGELVVVKVSEAFEDSFEGLIEYLGEEDSNRLADLLEKASRYYSEKMAGSSNQTVLNGVE